MIPSVAIVESEMSLHAGQETRNAVEAAGKKNNPCFFPADTTAFLALEGAKCCDTE